MTMTETLMTKHLIALCDGTCGGEVELTTDGASLAYAVVDGFDSGRSRERFVSQDCDGIEKRRDGSIVVTCAAYDPDAEERCGGYATFAREALAEEPYRADNGHAAFMVPMEVEE